MVFPIDCYPDNDLILHKLEQRSIKRAIVIDLRHLFGNSEAILKNLWFAAYSARIVAEAILNQLKEIREGKHINTEGWSIVKMDALRKNANTRIKHAERSLGLYRQILQKINDHDFSFLSEVAYFDEADFERKTAFCDEPKKAILQVAWRYGLTMVHKLEQSCEFLGQIINMTTQPQTIKIVFVDIPAVLCWGFKQAVQNQQSFMVILSTRKTSARSTLVDLSIDHTTWFKGSGMFLNSTNEILNFSTNKVFLINPSVAQKNKFKNHNQPRRYLVISNPNGTRYFQCINGIYHEITLQHILKT